MGTDNDNLNIFSIGIPSDKTLEECIDEGMSFKEANEAMKTKFVPIDKFEFVEGEVESGKKYYEEVIKPLRKGLTATLTKIE